MDNGQYKGVISHNYVDVVGVLGDSISVCDGERDKVKSIILHKSRWDVQCKDVAGDPVMTSNFIRLDGVPSAWQQKGVSSPFGMERQSWVWVIGPIRISGELDRWELGDGGYLRASM